LKKILRIWYLNFDIVSPARAKRLRRRQEFRVLNLRFTLF